MAAIDATLRRLQLERIPLYLIHWPDPGTPIEDTIQALSECARDGKVRYFSGLLAFDNFTVFVRLFLLAFTSLVTFVGCLLAAERSTVTRG